MSAHVRSYDYTLSLLQPSIYVGQRLLALL